MQNFQVQTILRSIPTLDRIPLRESDILLQPADKSTETAKRRPRKVDHRKIRVLAEAVILQSLEDLWSKTNRKKSVEFFKGDGFSLCADMAGMKVVDRLRLFRLLRRLDPELFDSRHARKVGSIVNSRS
jgi:hypothetical protein